MTHILGDSNLSCSFCKSFYFKVEATGNNKVFTKCCMPKKYMFDFNFEISDLIKRIVCNMHEESKHFQKNIRKYNSALPFASFGASIFTGNV